MKNYVQSGDVVTVTADRDILSGELVAMGALVGFAQTDAAEDTPVAIVTTGVYRASVAAAGDVVEGDLVYVDATTNGLTTDAGVDDVNPRAGIATLAGSPVDGFAEIHVKLNG